jgi:predicted dehydrogenase
VQPAQRPSWNYRAEEGGGIVLDMFSHGSYVLENLFGRVRAVTAKAVTHIPQRWDEQGNRYEATADDAAYGIFELEGGILAQINSSWTVRVNWDELVEFQVDGTDGSAVAGPFGCKVQPGVCTTRPLQAERVHGHTDKAGWLVELTDAEMRASAGFNCTTVFGELGNEDTRLGDFRETLKDI